MEKSHGASNSEGVCNKIYNAIGSNCASGKTNRSDSPPWEGASSESVKVHIESAVPSLPTKTIASKGKQLRVAARHQIQGHRRQIGHVTIAVPNDPNHHPMISTGHHEHHKIRREGGNHENLYSDYITRMKNKMGMISTKGVIGGETETETPPNNNNNRLGGRRDSFNEKILHFINRGKKKMITNSD